MWAPQGGQGRGARCWRARSLPAFRDGRLGAGPLSWGTEAGGPHQWLRAGEGQQAPSGAREVRPIHQDVFLPMAERRHRSPRGAAGSPSSEVSKPTWAWCWAPALGGPAGAGWHRVTPGGPCPPQPLVHQPCLLCLAQRKRQQLQEAAASSLLLPPSCQQPPSRDSCSASSCQGLALVTRPVPMP